MDPNRWRYRCRRVGMGRDARKHLSRCCAIPFWVEGELERKMITLKAALTSCESQRVSKTWKQSFRTNFSSPRYSRVWLSPWERRCDHMASLRTSRRGAAASPVVSAARLAGRCTRGCERHRGTVARKLRLAAPEERVWLCTSWACRPRRYPSLWRTFRTGTLCPSTLCFVTLRQQSVMYVRRYAEPGNPKRTLGEAVGHENPRVFASELIYVTFRDSFCWSEGFIK